MHHFLCSAIVSFLRIWLDTYPMDFYSPPLHSDLCTLELLSVEWAGLVGAVAAVRRKIGRKTLSLDGDSLLSNISSSCEMILAVQTSAPLALASQWLNVLYIPLPPLTISLSHCVCSLAGLREPALLPVLPISSGLGALPHCRGQGIYLPVYLHCVYSSQLIIMRRFMTRALCRLM